MSAFPYRRLAGSRHGTLSHASAWAGKDHILLVQGSRISETYQRVYYRDVMALLVMKRTRFMFDARLWLVPPLLIGLVASLPSDWRSTGSGVAALIGLAIAGYLYIAASFYGCRLYLATAVGNVAVASVFRTWQARKFNEQVKPLILAAQQAIATPPPLETPPAAPPEMRTE